MYLSFYVFARAGVSSSPEEACSISSRVHFGKFLQLKHTDGLALAGQTRLIGTKGTTHTTGMTGMTEITVPYLQSLGLPLRSLSPPFSPEFLKQKIIQEW